MLKESSAEIGRARPPRGFVKPELGLYLGGKERPDDLELWCGRGPRTQKMPDKCVKWL